MFNFFILFYSNFWYCRSMLLWHCSISLVLIPKRLCILYWYVTCILRFCSVCFQTISKQVFTCYWIWLLQHWICCYQTLFTKVCRWVSPFSSSISYVASSYECTPFFLRQNFYCSNCGKLLSMDKQSALLLPPVQRPYRNFSVVKLLSNQQNSWMKDQSKHDIAAYHIGCSSEE